VFTTKQNITSIAMKIYKELISMSTVFSVKIQLQ
jgi:hypothetical protein